MKFIKSQRSQDLISRVMRAKDFHKQKNGGERPTKILLGCKEMMDLKDFIQENGLTIEHGIQSERFELCQMKVYPVDDAEYLEPAI